MKKEEINKIEEELTAINIRFKKANDFVEDLLKFLNIKIVEYQPVKNTFIFKKIK